MADLTSFDYVIVGAGSAGCILAARLSEDAGARVLLIEAGKQDRDPYIRIPLAWMKFVRERRLDWGFDSEPEPGLDGRRIECTRGRVLGGCSTINAMAYVRGNRGDYDRWAASGLPGWTYSDLLPYFKRGETWEDGEDAFRGASGPVRVQRSRFTDPLIDAYRESATGLGHAFSEDFNGAVNEGVATAQQNIKDGRRHSVVDAYLRPALSRPNLALALDAHVTAIRFAGNRAVGVDFATAGQTRQVTAEREVIVSAGAINTPQLLMLSGIGPADALKTQGIDVRIASPGVGANLQDHLSAGMEFARTQSGPFHASMRLDRAALNVLRAYFLGTGPATDYPGGLVGFIKSEPGLPVPDLQFLFTATVRDAGPWFPLIRPAWADGFGCRAILLHPRSRGSVTLTSNDPRAPVRIFQNFLAEEADLKTLRTGLRMVREFSLQAPLDPFRKGERWPGAEAEDDAALDAYIRRTAITVHHPCATCRMGPDDASPLDAELRVKGAEALRVVDASAMPDLIGGNINAAVLVIAEKAADMIRGHTPLPAAGFA